MVADRVVEVDHAFAFELDEDGGRERLGGAADADPVIRSGVLSVRVKASGSDRLGPGLGPVSDLGEHGVVGQPRERVELGFEEIGVEVFGGRRRRVRGAGGGDEAECQDRGDEHWFLHGPEATSHGPETQYLCLYETASG